MKKNQKKWLILDVAFLIVITFTAIFFPLYINSKQSSESDNELILDINGIECIDCFESGTYELKISTNKIQYTKIPNEINGGSHRDNLTTDFQFTKKVKYISQISQNEYVIYLKLMKGTRSQVLNVHIFTNNIGPSWSEELWFYKFGGAIRIYYEASLL